MDKKISHYGVKGMRWGIRKDRSGGSGKGASLNKSVKGMSDDELKKAVRRLNLEKQYVDLVNQEKIRNRSVVERGAREVGAMIKKDGKNAISQYATKSFVNALDVAVPVAINVAKKKT